MTVFEKDGITMIHGDCMDYFATVKEKEFQLCIADPPYGIGDRLCDGGGNFKNTPMAKLYRESSRWDKKPSQTFFDELFRISCNQIICGGNYFNLPATRGFIVWDKQIFMPTMSRCEYFWTSFDCPSDIVTLRSNDFNRTHPTQKPVALYKWLLKNYAKEGDRILDPMAGSFSSAIACWDMGFEYVGIEKDKDYYDKAVQRFKNHVAQGRMFEPEPIQGTQESMGI